MLLHQHLGERKGKATSLSAQRFFCLNKEETFLQADLSTRELLKSLLIPAFFAEHDDLFYDGEDAFGILDSFISAKPSPPAQPDGVTDADRTQRAGH